MHYINYLVLVDNLFHAEHVANRAGLQQNFELVRVGRVALVIHPKRTHFTRLLNRQNKNYGLHCCTTLELANQVESLQRFLEGDFELLCGRSESGQIKALKFFVNLAIMVAETFFYLVLH